MKDFIEKSKLLADLDKYEHELSNLEDLKESLVGMVKAYLDFGNIIDRKIDAANEKIVQCRLLLKNTKKDVDDEI